MSKRTKIPTENCFFDFAEEAEELEDGLLLEPKVEFKVEVMLLKTFLGLLKFGLAVPQYLQHLSDSGTIFPQLGHSKLAILFTLSI